MKDYFQIVRAYLIQLNYTIIQENAENGILVIENQNKDVKNLILGVAEPILIFEQHIFKVEKPSVEIFTLLLQKNRDMIHGAFVLDETGKNVIFRDTLQLENLDLNELEGSINSLGLLLSEYSEQILNFSKH